jgi:hypothetical protein
MQKIDEKKKAEPKKAEFAMLEDSPNSRPNSRSVPEDRRTTRVQCHLNEQSSNKLSSLNKSVVFHMTRAQNTQNAVRLSKEDRGREILGRFGPQSTSGKPKLGGQQLKVRHKA